MVLTACEPELRGPPPSAAPQETMCFDTEAVRGAVDLYKEAPTPAARRRMESAFETLDSRIKGMEALAGMQSGAEREEADRRIADLKRRRELHWARAQTALAESAPIRRAEPVGESVDGPRGVRRAGRARGTAIRRTSPAAARPAPENLFQRLFR